MTAAWAQSLDGCLARFRGQPTSLSSKASLRWTHVLRARHDAVAVGIETVLCDDPLLTTRMADGPSPQPVIIDSGARLPVEARVVMQNPRSPWVAVGEGARQRRVTRLEATGSTVFRVPSGPEGLNLEYVLDELYDRGVNLLMVEGGARVLASFLRDRLVDFVVVTVACRLIGNAQSVRLELPPSLEIRPSAAIDMLRAGEDVLLAGPLPPWDDTHQRPQLRLVPGGA